MALLIVVACPVIASIAGGEGKPNYAVGVYRAEKKPLYYVLLSKSLQGQTEVSRNHIQRLFLSSELRARSLAHENPWAVLNLTSG